MLHELVGLDIADPRPVGADIGVGRDHGFEVELNDLDAGIHGPLQEPGIGLDVGIVGDDDVGLLGDERGQRACAGVGAPVRIADLERVAEIGSPACA